MDSTTKEETLRVTLPVAEILIIKRDIDLIKKLLLMPGKLRSYYGMYFTPYVALVCYEALNYLEKKGHGVEIERTSKYNIKEIRNKAKFFDLRLNQILQSASNVDLLQHYDFAQQMKYPELASWNVHDNLGVYFDSDKMVIGNTQYMVWVYQDEDVIKKPLTNMVGFDIQNAEAQALSFDMGRIIGSLSDGLSGVKDFITNDAIPSNINIYVNDFNTNRCWSNTTEKYKPIRLLLLHMLSSIGFILGIVKKCIIRDNGLLLRLEYVMYHSALERFKQLHQYTQNFKNEISDEKLLFFLSEIDFSESILLYLIK